jgi:hypothetical protein
MRQLAAPIAISRLVIAIGAASWRKGAPASVRHMTRWDAAAEHRIRIRKTTTPNAAKRRNGNMAIQCFLDRPTTH